MTDEMEYRYKKKDDLIIIARLIEKWKEDEAIVEIVALVGFTNALLNYKLPYILVVTIDEWAAEWAPLDSKCKKECIKHLFKGAKIQIR